MKNKFPTIHFIMEFPQVVFSGTFLLGLIVTIGNLNPTPTPPNLCSAMARLPSWNTGLMFAFSLFLSWSWFSLEFFSPSREPLLLHYVLFLTTDTSGTTSDYFSDSPRYLTTTLFPHFMTFAVSYQKKMFYSWIISLHLSLRYHNSVTLSVSILVLTVRKLESNLMFN